MQLHEKQQIAERLAADLERREIKPHWINHGTIDNPYIYDGKPIARKYIYYIAKGLQLDSIGIGTFFKIKTILDNE
jgi:hypothetical protein